MDREEYIDLYQAIARLGEKEKMCVILFYMEDYSIAEIADTLKIPVGTVKSRLNRARSDLKRHLGDEGEAYGVPKRTGTER